MIGIASPEDPRSRSVISQHRLLPFDRESNVRHRTVIDISLRPTLRATSFSRSSLPYLYVRLRERNINSGGPVSLFEIFVESTRQQAAA